MADIVAVNTRHEGRRHSYKAVFWLEVAMAATALVLMVGFVRVKKAKSDLTVDEKAALEMQSAKAEEDACQEGVMRVL